MNEWVGQDYQTIYPTVFSLAKSWAALQRFGLGNPNRIHYDSAMTLILKDVPPQVHRSLKSQAQRHKRTLNQEAIHCLEQAVSHPSERPTLTAPPPGISVGSILKSFSSRAELLDGFLDSRTAP